MAKSYYPALAVSFVILLLYYFFSSSSSTPSTDEADGNRPLMVIELFRHGARGPHSIRGDPYWEGREGMLTDVGKAQHVVLGGKMVKRYPFIKAALRDPKKVSLQSSNYDRTKESLIHHLWGMAMC